MPRTTAIPARTPGAGKKNVVLGNVVALVFKGGNQFVTQSQGKEENGTLQHHSAEIENRH